MAIKWYKFRTGANIQAKNLNEQLQDNIAQRVHYHDHSADPTNPTGGINPQGPRVWGDFVYIGDIVGNVGSPFDLSVYDHIHNSRIHRGEAGDADLAVNTQNRMTFSVLTPGDWEWKDHFWEADVDLPAGLYEDCAYLVYFQPFFNDDAATVLTNLNPSANFRSLQGVVPLNNKLLSYNVMAHSIEGNKFKVRMYAVGQGLRYGVIGRSEFQGMKEGKEWEVRRVLDGNFIAPSQVQVIDDRTYVLSEGSNKIAVFSNTDGRIVDVIRPPDPSYTIRSFGATRDVAVDWESTNPNDWVYEDELTYTVTMICHNDNSARVYTCRNGMFELLSDGDRVMTYERNGYAYVLSSLAYDATINIVNKFGKKTGGWDFGYSRIAGRLTGGSTGTTSKQPNSAQRLLDRGYTKRFAAGLGHDSALASWGAYSTIGFFYGGGISPPSSKFTERDHKTYGAYRSQPGSAVPRFVTGSEPDFQGDFSHYYGSWGDDAVSDGKYSGTLQLSNTDGVTYTALRGFTGSKPYQFNYEIIDIDPKGDVQLVSEEVGLETAYSVIVGVAGVKQDHGAAPTLTAESVKAELPTDMIPFAITCIPFSKVVKNSTTSYHNVQLVMVLGRVMGGYRIMTFFYYETTAAGSNPTLVDVTGAAWNVVDANGRMPLIGTDWDVDSTRIFDDMASKSGGLSLTDFDGTLTLDNPDENDFRYRIALYFTDARNHCVHVYQAVSDGPYLAHDLTTDELTTGARFQFSQWERDLSLSENGTLTGHIAATGKQAVYLGDWRVLPDWAMPTPPDPESDYGNYYSNQLRRLRSEFNYWPGDMARMAKYDIVGDGLIDNGDYLTQLLAENPIAKMGLTMYTRPMTYAGRRTVGDVFTFDPRIVQQILVRPYKNESLVEADEPRFSQPYLAFTPKVVHNGYVLQNESNQINTYCNSFFQVNDPDIDYIEVDYDLGQRVEGVFYAGSNVTGLSFIDQYRMVSREQREVSPGLFLDAVKVNNYSEWNIQSQSTTFTPWSNNINLNNFCLAMVVPPTPSQPAGWNWMMFRKRGNTNELSPSGTNQPSWFSIDDARLLTADDGILEGEIIYRVRLKLLQPAKDRLAATPITGFHGLEPGMSVPFAPTHLKQTNIFSGTPTLGSLYDTVVPKKVVGSDSTVQPAPVGALTNWSDMEKMTVGAPIPGYNLTELQRSTKGQGGFLDTVQLYDTPMSRGGLWFYLMSPPLRIFPKYISRYACAPDSASYQLAGPDLPYFYAGQTIEDAKCGWGNPIGLSSNILGQQLASGGTTGHFCIRDFNYYKILRNIKLLRESDVQ
jgi:hypothetical protein